MSKVILYMELCDPCRQYVAATRRASAAGDACGTPVARYMLSSVLQAQEAKEWKN